MVDDIADLGNNIHRQGQSIYTVFGKDDMQTEHSQGSSMPPFTVRVTDAAKSNDAHGEHPSLFLQLFMPRKSSTAALRATSNETSCMTMPPRGGSWQGNPGGDERCLRHRGRTGPIGHSGCIIPQAGVETNCRIVQWSVCRGSPCSRGILLLPRSMSIRSRLRHIIP